MNVLLPELPDEDKKNDSDSSDIASQQQPALGSQTAGTSTPASGQPTAAPTNSGLAQNFNSFRDANKSKLDALQNLTLQNSQKSVNDASAGFGVAKDKEVASLGANVKDFKTSPFANLNLNSDLSGVQDAYNTTKADANPGVANLASGQSYQTYKDAADRAANINTKAGTTDSLVQGGTNAANATQDSLLLQSMADYRKKAQDQATANKGVAEAALTGATGELGAKATDVNQKNTEYQAAAKSALKKLSGDIDTDLSTRAQTAEAARRAEAEKTASTTKATAIGNVRSTVNDQIKSTLAEPAPTLESAGLTPLGVPNYAAFQDQMASWKGRQAEAKRLSTLSDDQLLGEFNQNKTVDNAMLAFNSDTNAKGITADNIYRDDAQRQSQIAALQALVGGTNYNSKVVDPTQSKALSGLDQLVNLIKSGVSGKLASAKQYEPEGQSSSASPSNTQIAKNAAANIGQALDPTDPHNVGSTIAANADRTILQPILGTTRVSGDPVKAADTVKKAGGDISAAASKAAADAKKILGIGGSSNNSNAKPEDFASGNNSGRRKQN